MPVLAHCNGADIQSIHLRMRQCIRRLPGNSRPLPDGHGRGLIYQHKGSLGQAMPAFA